jgi:GTPase-activating protein SAC7
MMPKEHGLSQDVLEFLIAHQDWFMLDIPPPPQSSASMGEIQDDVEVMPSSDEEVGGGWKLVDRTDSMRITRRRTFTDRSEGPCPLHSL